MALDKLGKPVKTCPRAEPSLIVISRCCFCVTAAMAAPPRRDGPVTTGRVRGRAARNDRGFLQRFRSWRRKTLLERSPQGLPAPAPRLPKTRLASRVRDVIEDILERRTPDSFRRAGPYRAVGGPDHHLSVAMPSRFSGDRLPAALRHPKPAENDWFFFPLAPGLENSD